MFYNKKSGFSLAEVLAILAILSIFASLLIPYFNEVFAKQEVNKVTTSISRLIKAAKNEANLQNSTVVLCSSTDGRQCTSNRWNNTLLIFSDLNKNRQVDVNELIYITEVLNLKYGNLTWKGALNSSSIVFEPITGLPIGYNGSFYYCNQNIPIQQKMILSKMGHMRIETATNC